MQRPRPVILPDTVVHTLRPPGFEDVLRVEVSTPFEYAATKHRYPVVYLIDSHWFFPIVSQAVRLIGMDGEIPPLIVAGIGYEPGGFSPAKEEERILDLRCRDLTPTRDTREWWRQAGGKSPGPGVETGHAEEFIQIIEQQVKPLVRARFRADAGDETLAGFSFGGLFALYTLFCHGSLFERYVAGSPALWWDDGILFELEREYAAQHADLDKTLFLSVGALEEESEAGAACKMVSHFERLTARLRARSYPSLKWTASILEAETHSTGVSQTFIKGLLSVFRARA